MKDRLFIYHVFINHDPTRKDEIGFCSSIDGLINQLDYVEFMGFNCIMTNPLFPCESYHGYDITNFYEIDPNIGTMEDFERLLKELDKRNMKLIFDITLAHTSNIHDYFKDFINGKNDFYILKDEISDDMCTDMHNTIHFWMPEYNKYLLCAFHEGMPSLNVESQSLRQEVRNILHYWMRKGNNLGFRLDAIYHNNVTANNHDGIPYCEFIRECVDEINPDCILIGEVWNNRNMLNEPIEYSKTLGDVFNFYDSFGIMLQVAGGSENISIQNPYFRSVLFPGNHDTTRVFDMVGRDVNKVKDVLRYMILETDCDVSIYYGTEACWYGSVTNGYDLPVRSNMSIEHMAHIISGKYNSLVYYIRDLIKESKMKR